MDTILINGYTGKLGKAIYAYLKPHYHLIGCNQNNPIEHVIQNHKPNIIIDVTNAKIIPKFLKLYQQLKIPTIIGTSGISPKLAYSLTKEADFPLIIVPNFSLSFQSFAKSCLLLSPYAQSIQIIENHHKNKIDVPSGTALFLADILQTTHIKSIRVDRYIAEHEVIFVHPHHKISLTHQINSLEEFLPGVLSAIHKIQHEKTPMVLFSDQ
jgi:4-hydroxy-tetrahydrodipicolinate reductase